MALQSIIVHVSASSKLLFKTITINIVWINPSHFCPLCLAITSWWLWREKSCWRRGWLVIVSSNANHDKSDPESNPPVSLLFCTFGVISIQRGIITMVKWLLPTYLLFYQKQLTKLFFCFFLDHSYVFMCRTITKQIKSGRFLFLNLNLKFLAVALLKKSFLDALASLDFKLWVGEWLREVVT